ncbi:MAG: PQQ-dependent sugar dehydrogenase [Acidobacteriota bacterium]
MTRLVFTGAVAALTMLPAALLAQPAAPAPAPQTRASFEKFTVEGQPVDRRKTELDSDHPVFPGQTRAPYHKTTDLAVTTIASGLDVPWAVELLPSGRFLITEKAGRLRILNQDGSTLHTITASMPPVYFRGQAGLLDVALDKNFATNHRIFFVYLRIVDTEHCAHAVDSAILNEDAGTVSNVTTIFQAAPFSNRAVAQSGSRIVVDPKDGNLFVAVGDRSTGDPLPLQAQQLDTYLGKVIHVTPEGKPAPGNPSLGLPGTWSMGHRTPQGLAFAPDGRLWEVEHGPRGGDELNLIEKGKNYGWPVIVHGINYPGTKIGAAIVEKAGLEQPRYYWDPVIAPSSLVFYEGTLFPQWQTSALVGALAGQALFRLELGKDDKVVNEEPLLMDLGARIRDVKVFPDGAVYVLTEGTNGKLLKVTPKP